MVCRKAGIVPELHRLEGPELRPGVAQSACRWKGDGLQRQRLDCAKKKQSGKKKEMVCVCVCICSCVSISVCVCVCVCVCVWKRLGRKKKKRTRKTRHCRRCRALRSSSKERKVLSMYENAAAKEHLTRGGREGKKEYARKRKRRKNEGENVTLTLLLLKSLAQLLVLPHILKSQCPGILTIKNSLCRGLLRNLSCAYSLARLNALLSLSFTRFCM